MPKGNKFDKIKEHIKKVYLADRRPFVVGLSGGKDSSLTLQLTWEAIEELPKEQRFNDVYVITVDTLIETPYIINHINATIAGINKTAKEDELPIHAHKLTPDVEKSFWVNLLGKGYPAPSQMFRWCTERLKIEPVNVFVRANAAKYGEVTILLGARKSESASRSQVLKKKEKTKNALGLTLHPSLEGAYVLTPIEDLTADDVWEYLFKNPITQWGGSNRDLAAMYKNASSGECPMVVDTSTPSCGNSRFGCWACTLVKKDTSMENVIDSGEEWMLPLLEFRDLLSSTQEPDLKPKYRSYKRRDGQASIVRDGTKLSYGPYKIEWREKFLRTLLKAQKEVRKNGPNKNYTLILHEELKIIRRIWNEEEPERGDALPKICHDELGDELSFDYEDGVNLSISDYKLLEEICKKEDGVQSKMIAKLINEERKMHGMSKRAGIIRKLDKVFSEEWRTEEEVIAEDTRCINEN